MGTSRRHRSTPDTAPALAPVSTGGTGGDQDLVGNAAVAERFAGGDLYGTLRARVGDALADLILEHLSEDELVSYITPSLEALLARAQEASAKAEHGLSDADLESAFSQLDQELAQAAAEVFGRLQIDARLAQVVKDQPELALATALAGVVIWALSNPDLPALSLSSKLGGGHALKGTVDLGRLQSLAVERLALEWSWSSENTSAKLEGNWKSGTAGSEWGLGAMLTHDGTHTDGSLEARLDKGPAGNHTGYLSGNLTRETDAWAGHLSGRADLDGSWSAAGGIGSSPARTDQPWSLTGTVGQSALDSEADWSVTGRYGRALDKDGRTVLGGSQMVGRNRSSTRLDLTHDWDGGSATGWVERSRSEAGTVDALGGSLEAQIGDNVRAYGQGWVRSDDTWDVSAGIRSGSEADRDHWFAEGFSARDQFGQQDHGVRAGYRLRF